MAEPTEGPLACPACGSRHSLEERFCNRCGMPLTRRGAPVEEEPRSEAHGRARKIRPELTAGRLVAVAAGRNQAEAELIQNLLLEEGVPSTLRRTRGFDVPDFLAAGPRDVLVPESAVEVARGALLQAELIDPGAQRAGGPSARQTVTVVGAILAGSGLVVLVAWALLGAG